MSLSYQENASHTCPLDSPIETIPQLSFIFPRCVKITKANYDKISDCDLSHCPTLSSKLSLSSLYNKYSISFSFLWHLPQIIHPHPLPWNLYSVFGMDGTPLILFLSWWLNWRNKYVYFWKTMVVELCMLCAVCQLWYFIQAMRFCRTDMRERAVPTSYRKWQSFALRPTSNPETRPTHWVLFWASM